MRMTCPPCFDEQNIQNNMLFFSGPPSDPALEGNIFAHMMQNNNDEWSYLICYLQQIESYISIWHAIKYYYTYVNCSIYKF